MLEFQVSQGSDLRIRERRWRDNEAIGVLLPHDRESVAQVRGLAHRSHDELQAERGGCDLELIDDLEVRRCRWIPENTDPHN